MFPKVIFLLCCVAPLGGVGAVGGEDVGVRGQASVTSRPSGTPGQREEPQDSLRQLAWRLQDLGAALQEGTRGTVAPQEQTGADDPRRVGLAQLVGTMRLISRTLSRRNSSDVLPQNTTTPSTPTTEGTEKYLPCLEPFQEIAYRMCILQETRRKMTWPEARSFCWSQGADLAQDAVVVKVRRLLNEQYGEEGTRVRWPMWVGGKQKEGGQGAWQWAASGSAVPAFLWSPEQPRPYQRSRAPEGLCMYLDGYNAFYGASLPCHLKRRFVCQRRD